MERYVLRLGLIATYGILGAAFLVLFWRALRSGILELYPALGPGRRRWMGVAYTLMLASFSAIIVVQHSGGDVPLFLTAPALAFTLAAMVLSFVLAVRPATVLRPTEMKAIGRHQYRLEDDGIVVYAYGLGGFNSRPWHEALLWITNKGQSPVTLEAAHLETKGRTYEAEIRHKRRPAPLTLNPGAAIPVNLRLRFDRPLRDAYGDAAQLTLRFRRDSQTKHPEVKQVFARFRRALAAG